LTPRLDPATGKPQWRKTQVAQSPRFLAFLDLMGQAPDLWRDICKSITTCTALSQTCQLGFQFIGSHMVSSREIRSRQLSWLTPRLKGRWDYAVAGFPQNPGPCLLISNPRIYFDDLKKSLSPEELSMVPSNAADLNDADDGDKKSEATRANLQLSKDFKMFGDQSRRWALANQSGEMERWARQFISTEAKTGTYEDLGRAPLGIVQQLPSTGLRRLRQLFTSTQACGRGVKVLHLDNIPFVDIRAISIMVGGLPCLESLTVVNCPQIHIACVPTLLDIVERHMKAQEEMLKDDPEADVVPFHLDVFPRFHNGPRNSLRRAVYGVTFNKVEEFSVLRGVLVSLIKIFVKGLGMNLDTPVLAKDTLLFKWMNKVPAEDDFWAKFITHLRAYEKFFSDETKGNKPSREKKKLRNLTLSDDIFAMIFNPDNRRVCKRELKASGQFWLREQKRCLTCEYYMPNVCFDGYPEADRGHYCMGCELHMALDNQTDHLNNGIMKTLDLLYGTRRMPANASANLQETDPEELERRYQAQFPGPKALLKQNGLIRDMPEDERVELRGTYLDPSCHYVLKDNTSDLPALQELLGASWEERWSKAAGGAPPPSGKEYKWELLRGQQDLQRFVRGNVDKRLWKPTFAVKGAVNLDFAFLQMQTIGRVSNTFWEPMRSSLEHEQDRGRQILHDEYSKRRIQHSYRQTATKLLYKLEKACRESARSGDNGVLMSTFFSPAHDDRAFEYEVGGFSRVHQHLARVADYFYRNHLEVDGLKITTNFISDDPLARPAFFDLVKRARSQSPAAVLSSSGNDSTPDRTPPTSRSSTPASSPPSVRSDRKQKKPLTGSPSPSVKPLYASAAQQVPQSGTRSGNQKVGKSAQTRRAGQRPPTNPQAATQPWKIKPWEEKPWEENPTTDMAIFEPGFW
jgi:hypothetical protein